MKPIRSVANGLRTAFSDPQVLTLVGIVFTIIAGASVFYHYAEGWGWLDAVYFSVITISTVGYGDFFPQTDLGKVFTVGYIFVGLGVFVAAATQIANAIINDRPSEFDGDHD